MEDITHRKRIIDIFVNAVYVYEDKLVFTYNFQERNETVRLADIELALVSHSSDIANSTSPEKSTLRRAFFIEINPFGICEIRFQRVGDLFHFTFCEAKNFTLFPYGKKEKRTQNKGFTASPST